MTRIGDSDRDHAVAMLQEHLIAGRLDSNEFDQRVDGALQAKTVGDLRHVFSNLPNPYAPRYGAAPGSPGPIAVRPHAYPPPTGGTGQPALRPATGAFAWWSMFLSFIPFVGVLSWVLATGAMAFGRVHPHGSIARENGRNGFNWALTCALAWFVGAGVMLTLSRFDPSGGADPARPTFWLGAFVLLVILASNVLAWVHAIRGGVHAGRGGIYQAWGAIPFIGALPQR